jgi:hypothetical protein
MEEKMKATLVSKLKKHSGHAELSFASLVLTLASLDGLLFSPPAAAALAVAMPAVLPLRPLEARGGCWKEASLNTSYSGSGTTFSFAASGRGSGGITKKVRSEEKKQAEMVSGKKTWRIEC